MFKKQIFIVANIILFIFSAQSTEALTETIQTKAQFDEGMYQQTNYDDVAGELKLSSGANSGEYFSQIFDMGRETQFSSLSWKPSFPIGKEMPNNNGVETVYARGNMDMSANKVLMHLNESGMTTFTDTSGNGNDGTCTGANCPTSVSGIFGNAQYINGASLSRISIPSNNDTNPGSDPFTICHWFKIDDASGTDEILYNKENLYEAKVSNGYYQYAWRPHWAWDGGNSFSVNSNTWYFACLVYDQSTQKLYKNGVEVFSRNQTGDMGTNSNNLCLGARGTNDCNNSRYTGVIDEFALWHRALTAQEIQNLYWRGVSHLSVSARSCADSNCSTEGFASLGGDDTTGNNIFPVKNLSLDNNQYFQFKVTMESDDGTVLPALQSVSFDYTYINHPPTSITLSTTTINEITPSGTPIATITTTDPDPTDTHTYTLVQGSGDEDNALFTIDGNQLKLNFTPDYENPIDQGDTPGNNTYGIRIQSDDGHGGIYAKSFIITVQDVDENTPVLTLLGQNPLTLTQGSSFTDPGATAFDQEDGDISANIQVTGTVDTTTPGTYTLTYTVQDSAGNQATPVTRTVIVKERKKRSHKSKRLSRKELAEVFKTTTKTQAQKDEKPSFTCNVSTTRLLKRGMQGEEVQQLQHCLNTLGYPAGPEDGIFGPQTYQGVLSFQQAKQLRFVDGVVGEETVRALQGGEERISQMQEQKNEEETFDRKVILQKIDTLEKILFDLKKLIS